MTAVEIVGIVVLFAAPVVAAAIASAYALRGKSPGSAFLRAFLATWLLSVVLGVAGGGAIDFYNSKTAGRGSMIPAFVAFGMVELFVAWIWSLIVGAACAHVLRRRDAVHPPA